MTDNFLFAEYSPKLGDGERRAEMISDLLHFIGWALFLLGLAGVWGTWMDNQKVPKRAWDTSELFCYYGGGGSALLGFVLLLFGCGGSLPEPTDPVHVEVTVCEPRLGTEGQYLALNSWRREIGVCEAMRADLWEREEILGRAESDLLRLGEEYDVYQAEGRTDCYCGPVCQEMVNFVEQARIDGRVCGP